jgi:hypothetical protein
VIVFIVSTLNLLFNFICPLIPIHNIVDKVIIHRKKENSSTDMSNDNVAELIQELKNLKLRELEVLDALEKLNQSAQGDIGSSSLPSTPRSFTSPSSGVPKAESYQHFTSKRPRSNH